MRIIAVILISCMSIYAVSAKTLTQHEEGGKFIVDKITTVRKAISPDSSRFMCSMKVYLSDSLNNVSKVYFRLTNSDEEVLSNKLLKLMRDDHSRVISFLLNDKPVSPSRKSLSVPIYFSLPKRRYREKLTLDVFYVEVSTGEKKLLLTKSDINK